MKLVALAACIACLACTTAFAQSGNEPRGVGPIVERVLRGEDPEAPSDLSDAVLGPLMRAIGSLERDFAAGRDRTPAEQRRLRDAIARLNSELSLRLYELDLPAEEIPLLRQFVRENPELTLRLFSPRTRDRLDAVGRVSLQAGSPSGVVLGARIDDEDEDVAHAALDAALKLHDPVVARRVRHYVDRVTQAVSEGAFGAAEQELVRSLSIIVEKALRVLAAAEDRDSAPIAASAFALMMKPQHWLPFECAAAARSLGALRDERAVPALLPHLEDPRASEMRAVGPGQSVQQTVGDAVLLALLRIYGIEPARLGMSQAGEEDSRITGFADHGTRSRAVQRFKAWHERNAGLPAAQRGPLEPIESKGLPPDSRPASAPIERPARAAPQSQPVVTP